MIDNVVHVISPKYCAWRRVNGADVQVLVGSRIAFQPGLADGVRFAYYLLLVLIKSNTFSCPDISNRSKTRLLRVITGGRTTVRQYLGESAKNRAEIQRVPENLGPSLGDAVEPTLARLRA